MNGPAIKLLARGSAAAILLIGAIALVGWTFGWPVFRSMFPAMAEMKPNTALGLMFSAAALWQLSDSTASRWVLRTGQACAGAGALIGLLTLAEYIAGVDLGIDTLLFADALSAVQAAHPGRMHPNSAAALLSGNAALLLLAGASERSFRITAAGSASIFTLLLGLFGAEGLVDVFAGAAWDGASRMSLNGALAFVLLGAATLACAWMSGSWRWSLSLPVAAGSLLGLLVLVALNMASNRSTRQFADMAGSVQRTHRVWTTLSEFDAAIELVNVGSRGFAFTGRDDFLAPYRRGQQRAPELARLLHGLVAEHPGQQVRLDQLDALLQEKLVFTTQVVEARLSGGPGSATELIDTGRGRTLLEAIYAITSKMAREEQGVLVQREAQLSAMISRTFIVLRIGTLVALGLFLSVLLRLNAEATRRRQVEVDMHRLNGELDQRVAERTAQLEVANGELEAFTYSVSHDLRAPLRGVDSFSRMVIEDYGPALDDEGRRMLNVVRSESQRMGQLIDDLLAFSRVGRQELRSQSIDMDSLVKGVIDKLDPRPGPHYQISVGPLPEAWGDPNLIRQVLINLLSNAVKFSHHQPSPVIEIGATRENDMCVFHVTDNGVGFDARYVHKLFGVFQRLHTDSEFEGTGVGLALVQRIVHRHGGKVAAEGQVDRGATFRFSLPHQEAGKS